VGLDVYFRRDIANALQAIAVANADEGDVRKGFERALVAVGFAFGLLPAKPEITTKGAAPALLMWAERED
jgi:hypothetical protein